LLPVRGGADYRAFITSKEDATCSRIIAQSMLDQDALDIVTVFNAYLAIIGCQNMPIEPVVWMYEHPTFKTDYGPKGLCLTASGYAETPLYAAPQPAPDHAATLQKLAEVEDKLDRIAYKDRDLSSGLSWDGYVICGDARAIDAVKKALYYSIQIDEYRKGFVERTDALTAKLAEEREARLISEACAVKTHEMLMEALDAEKANLAKLTDMMVRYLKPETYVDVNGKAWPTGVARIAFINDVIYTLDPPKS